MLEGKVAKNSDMSAYLEVRKKYNSIFRENANELEDPSMNDVLTMNSRWN